MDNTEHGRSPLRGSGYSAEPGPISVVPAVPVSIPNAAWRPIETAPKDGTPLLLFGPDGRTGVGFIEYQEFDDAQWFHSTAAWIGKDQWRDGRTNVTFGGRAPEEATHWMPLPLPPASGILTEGGDAEQAPGESLSSPASEAGDAQSGEPND